MSKTLTLRLDDDQEKRLNLLMLFLNEKTAAKSINTAIESYISLKEDIENIEDEFLNLSAQETAFNRANEEINKVRDFISYIPHPKYRIL